MYDELNIYFYSRSLWEGTKSFAYLRVSLRGELHVFKEFTLRELTYKLRGQEEKKSTRQIQDKQAPHTTLQKTISKKGGGP